MVCNDSDCIEGRFLDKLAVSDLFVRLMQTIKLLEQMQIFSRVAEMASFTRAADSMGLPKASVSQAVQQLERSEEHTSELQSQSNLVCRLLLEKKNQRTAT